MPVSWLWAVDIFGKVQILSVKGQEWERVGDGKADFKRVSAVDRTAWGIGGDHQVYVYVRDPDVPIRIKEVTYENERWNPRNGFCSRLLPTDRPAWSSDDGLQPRFKNDVKLPSDSWQWADDWRIEDNLDGHHLGPQGWTYAIDFPATFFPAKTWLSCVRRRKWIRFRQFIACNAWSLVPGIHEDPLLEPFIDVSVGGLDVPGGDGETLAVWTVTILGRVMFRQGVTCDCPEGEKWVHVPTFTVGEINQLSVSPTGLVWAITWDGQALVRLGVTRRNLVGDSWAEVNSPSDSSKLLQVAVGTNVVWAISRDNKVWFRKGVCDTGMGHTVESAKGSGWVEMVGEMSLISVGPNDQVWALGRDDRRTLFYRSGITPYELSGKAWKIISVPSLSQDDLSAPNGDDSKRFDESLIESDCFLDRFKRSFGTSEPNEVEELMSELLEDPISTQGTTTNKDECEICEIDHNSNVEQNSTKLVEKHDQKDGEITEEKPCQIPEIDMGADNCVVSDDKEDSTGNVLEDAIECLISSSPTRYSPVNVLSKRVCGESESVSSSSSEKNSSYREFMWPQINSGWVWVDGGGCVIDAHVLPDWFGPAIENRASYVNKPWRKQILHSILTRHSFEVDDFASIPDAVDKSTWSVTAKVQFQLNGRSPSWIDGRLELERTGSRHSFTDSAILHFSSACEQIDIDISKVTGIMCAYDRSKSAMTIFAGKKALIRRPARISLMCEDDKEDWMALLNSVCCDVRKIQGSPSAGAIWATTLWGDIFVCDPYNGSTNCIQPIEMFWRQFGGHLEKIETCAARVVWGLGYNHAVWVYSGGWGGGFHKGAAACSFGIHPMFDVRCMYIYENQRWNPLTGFTNHGLPTDRYMWSDRSGRCECTKENTKLPSGHWQWITDWIVDLSTPDGVDKDGWQYARDFPMAYSGHKGFTDYVRRRRWVRKCKLVVNGPWLPLNSVSLLDVSMFTDKPGSGDVPVRLWAVSKKGEVLCRIGVTASCPQGLRWEYVVSEFLVIAISVGGNGHVWVLTSCGIAMLRNGVSEHNATGTSWFVVEPPDHGCPLKQISVGAQSVWAVDQNNNLWYRQEIRPIFPEGTCWKLVCGNVNHVSVGPTDEVWAVIGGGITPASLAKRVGVDSQNIIGTGWEYGIMGGWQYISARGSLPEELGPS